MKKLENTENTWHNKKLFVSSKEEKLKRWHQYIEYLSSDNTRRRLTMIVFLALTPISASLFLFVREDLNSLLKQGPWRLFGLGELV